MSQPRPINGRILVKIAGQYKHVNLNSDKQHQLASSTGVVLDVADDLAHIVGQAFKIQEGTVWPEGVLHPDQLKGKTIRWEKFAEQNSLHEIDDPADSKKKIKVALIEYKDITSYEN